MLGLCFGGQALAAALGGTVERAPRPELGWTEIETDEPELVPPGPWLEWHYERFTTPPGATEIARTAAATQAFRHGRHLGVQFHPESTVEIVERWAASDRDRLAALGHGDGAALIGVDAGGPRGGARAPRSPCSTASWKQRTTGRGRRGEEGMMAQSELVGHSAAAVGRVGQLGPGGLPRPARRARAGRTCR